MRYEKYDYLIVGCGLYGITFAREMTNAGKTCVIIDMRKHIGGNCYTEKIENIDVFLKEIEEVNKNIPLIAKVVSDKLNDIVEQDLDIYETEEYKKYSVEVIRVDLLMKEANNILTEVVYLLKSMSLLNIDISDELQKLVDSKEYIDQKRTITSNNIFVVNKFGKIEEKEANLFNTYVETTLQSEVVKNMIDAFRTRGSGTD